MTTLFETDPVALHVGALARMLRGPAGVRRSMLAEARDGLEDAAAAYEEGGLGPREAAGLAVRDFGSVAEIAPLYQEELTARQGRRTALLLAVVFPAMMLAWDLLWSNGISWTATTPPPPPIVGVLAGAQDGISLGIAALELLLLGATFLRRVPQHHVARAVGVIAVLASGSTLATCLFMHVVNIEGTNSMLATGFAAPAAYIVSVGVIVVITRSALRTLRLTRLRDTKNGPELAV